MINLVPTTAVYGETKTLKGRLVDGGDDYVQYLEYVQVVSPTGRIPMTQLKQMYMVILHSLWISMNQVHGILVHGLSGNW